MAYLDHAATTPMLPEAVAAMTELLGEPGNPSSLHASGRKARRHVEESRDRIARALGASPSEVVFTAGGTESDNLAIKGIAWSRRDADPKLSSVAYSAVEHHAVLDTVEWLGNHEGFTEVSIEVDALGRVHVDALKGALTRAEGTALVSIMWANNEVGTVNNISALAQVCGDIPLHTDAAQAVAWESVDFSASGATALTVSGHKVGGPQGIGALLLKRDAQVTPLLHGGGQERQIRSGTLDVASIVGLATAIEVTVARRETVVSRVRDLRDELISRVLAVVPDAQLSGDPVNRLANNAHFIFPGCLGDSLLMLLDAKGVEVSVGSACSAGVPQPSHVLLAMGVDSAAARSTLRFSLGSTSTPADVSDLIAALPAAVERARAAGVPR